jgi:hypothetical protein
MRQRTNVREVTTISVKTSVLDGFSAYARQNGYTVSGAAEKALLWWMNTGHRQQLAQFLAEPGTATHGDLYSSMVKDEIKAMTKMPKMPKAPKASKPAKIEAKKGVRRGKV